MHPPLRRALAAASLAMMSFALVPAAFGASAHVNTSMSTSVRRSVRVHNGTVVEDKTDVKHSTNTSTPHLAVDLNAKTGEAYDRAFVEAMIPHHESAVRMARMALRKASHSALRALAQTMIDDQRAEIRLMKDWRHEWNGLTLRERMDIRRSVRAHGKSMERDLRRLRGSDFDKKFLEHMIMHHQQAVDMSAAARTKATHPELRALAATIEQAQRREIEQMRKWLNDWK